jgi:hypothetical protein
MEEKENRMACARTTNWQVVGDLSIAIPAGKAQTGFLIFSFLNSDEGRVYPFAFVGVGFGMPSLKTKSGAKNVPVSLSDPAWSTVECIRPFNDSDLSWSVGQVFAGGVSTLVGYTFTWITGGISPLDAPYFRLSPCHGLSVGFGLTLSVSTGLWKALGVPYYVDVQSS